MYDLGANCGYFSLLASVLTGKKGKVYAFEPMQENIYLLIQHVNANRAFSIHVLGLAITDENKKIVFTDSGNLSANTYIDASPVFNVGKKIELQGRSLDSLVYDDKLLPPDFIKIDIEGAEFDALKGGERVITQHRPVIYLSTHNNHLEGVEEKCKNVLHGLGYELEKRKGECAPVSKPIASREQLKHQMQ